jgi:hypothetical protein
MEPLRALVWTVTQLLRLCKTFCQLNQLELRFKKIHGNRDFLKKILITLGFHSAWGEEIILLNQLLHEVYAPVQGNDYLQSYNPELLNLILMEEVWVAMDRPNA